MRGVLAARALNGYMWNAARLSANSRSAAMLATLSCLIVCHLGSGSRPPRNEAERALLYQQLQDIVEAPELAMEENTSSKFLVAEDLEVVPEAETLPLSTEVYAADPSAHLFEGRIYVYCSHDSPAVVQGLEVPHFNMVDYVVLSRDARGGGPTAVHANVLKLEDVPWASGKLWAPDAAYKDGTYYLFLPAQDRPSAFQIGVVTYHNLNPSSHETWRRHLALSPSLLTAPGPLQWHEWSLSNWGRHRPAPCRAIHRTAAAARGQLFDRPRHLL